MSAKTRDCAVSFAYGRSQARIHTGFHRFTEIGQIYKRDIFLVKKTFQVDILFHIHYNMKTDHDEMILRFARLHHRRMELANIPSE